MAGRHAAPSWKGPFVGGDTGAAGNGIPMGLLGEGATRGPGDQVGAQ